MPEEEKKEDDKIVLQVDMHCEGCKAKVRKALKEFKGVEGLDLNMQDKRVTIRGKLDAKKVYETVKKKSGKRTILLYPDPKKIAEDAEKKAKEEPKKEEPPPPPEPEVTVVLKVNMHCRACAKQIRRSLLKMDGVTDAKEDFAKCTVTVKGKNLDPNKLCARVKKRSGKHCEVVPPPPPPPAPPKEEEKKEEAKPAEEKKEEEKKDEAKPTEEAKKEEEKPAEAPSDAAPAAAEAAPAPATDAAPAATEPEKKAEEKKEEEKKEAAPEEKKEEKAEEKKEEKKEEEKKEEKKEEAPEEAKIEIKKYEYIPYRSVPEYYVYPPQLFSDENPNACSVM